jgi:hypothetical protein
MWLVDASRYFWFRNNTYSTRYSMIQPHDQILGCPSLERKCVGEQKCTQPRVILHQSDMDHTWIIYLDVLSDRTKCTTDSWDQWNWYVVSEFHFWATSIMFLLMLKSLCWLWSLRWVATICLSRSPIMYWSTSSAYESQVHLAHTSRCLKNR